MGGTVGFRHRPLIGRLTSNLPTAGADELVLFRALALEDAPPGTPYRGLSALSIHQHVLWLKVALITVEATTFQSQSPGRRLFVSTIEENVTYMTYQGVKMGPVIATKLSCKARRWR